MRDDLLGVGCTYLAVLDIDKVLGTYTLTLSTMKLDTCTKI